MFDNFAYGFGGGFCFSFSVKAKVTVAHVTNFCVDSPISTNHAFDKASSSNSIISSSLVWIFYFDLLIGALALPSHPLPHSPQ